MANATFELDRPINPIESTGYTAITDSAASTQVAFITIVLPYIVNVEAILKAVNELPDIDAGTSSVVEVTVVDE
jgi:hypothetical protein